MDSSAAARLRARHRVADADRRRALQACDRCKHRKSKCVPVAPGVCHECQRKNSRCQFRRANPSPSQGERPVRPVLPVVSPGTEAPAVTTQRARSPEERLSINSHQTEKILWPRFLTKIREAFSLEPQTSPEEEDIVAIQARITQPKTLRPSDQARLQTALDSFPPRPVAEFLASVCINHGVDTFFYFDQAQMMAEIGQFYSNDSPLRSDPNFVCFALAIFALGSHWTPLEKPKELENSHYIGGSDPGRVFFNQAKLLMPDIIERPCLRSTQACFILSVYLLPLNAMGSAYIYMGMALRKALALDLHQCSDDQVMDEKEREVRRRLWWSIYSLERCTTIKLNRPRSIDAGIIKVALPSRLPILDDHQKFDNLGFQIAYARLIKILDHVEDSGACLAGIATSTQSSRIETELREWEKSLPKTFLKAIHPKDSRYRAVIHIYLNYYYAWIALGKDSLVAIVRAKLRYHLGQVPAEPSQIHPSAHKQCEDCKKAARKMLQLFQDLTHAGKTNRFSFTDFQGCSIATIVTLIAGILERDATYDARVAFGLNFLNQMAAGHLTARMGVRFVEALKSISDEAVEKLRQCPTFYPYPEVATSTSPSAYNRWAEWLASQEQAPNSPEESDGQPPGRQLSGGEARAHETQHERPSALNGEDGWNESDGSIFQPVTVAPQAMDQTDPLRAIAADADFNLAMYNEEQHFLMGLTGLDLLDFSELTEQLNG